MKRTAGMIGWLLMAVAVICLSVGISVYAKEKSDREQMRAYYQEQEKQLVSQVRGFLAEQGYRNSGVMLTKTTFADGTVEYKLTVHHGLINKLDDEETQELLEQLAEFTFPADNCTFVPEFL